MAVTKRPPLRREPSEAEALALINRAPDARASASPTPGAVADMPVSPVRSPKKGISLTLRPELLARIDATAERLNLSRAAAIALACTKWVDAEQKGS